MATLIQIQEAAISKLDVTRSSDRRYARLVGSVRRWYFGQLRALGFTDESIRATWQDAVDMLTLRRNAE